MKPTKLPRSSDTKRRQLAGPVQAEWDFSQCPPDCLYYCWAYEFARESPYLILHYREDQKFAKEYPNQWMFDENGNWHHTVHVLGNSAFSELRKPVPVNSLVIASGFPDAPYLQTKHDPFGVLPYERTLTKEQMLRKLVFNGNPDDFKKFDKVDHESHESGWPRKPHALRLRWDFPDKKLVEAFKVWLKDNRPFPALRDGRGKSAFKKYESDLKALAAYRLLRTLKVTEAMEHMRKCGRNPLFRTVCDWSTAKSHAAKVLREKFQAEPYFSD